MPNDKAESTAARSEFAELLDLLGIGPGERVPICSQKPGGRFEADTVPPAPTPRRWRCRPPTAISATCGSA